MGWVIILRRVSLLSQRFRATFAALWVIGAAAVGVAAEQPADSTWTALRPLPHQGRAAVFALAVDPTNNQVLVAANSERSLLRSPNGGGSWAAVHTA